MKRRAQALRDLLVFLMGMTGIAQQTFFAHKVSSPLLVLFAGMVGLPSMLHIDEIRFSPPPKDSEK